MGNLSASRPAVNIGQYNEQFTAETIKNPTGKWGYMTNILTCQMYLSVSGVAMIRLKFSIRVKLKMLVVYNT
jgi:hypothetical protein